MSYIFDVRKGWSDWTSSFEWNVCGTLNFAVDRKPSLTEAQRHWSTFWNKIDRLCYGKSLNHQHRIPRFVYTHHGRGGDNPHIHFIAHTPTDPQEFCILLNAIWSGLNDMTAIPDQNEILPVFNKRRASWYLMHEDRGYEADGFNDTLTHLPESRGDFRTNALTKLRSEADRFLHLQDAEKAYGKHIEQAEQRHIRRIAN